MKRILIQVFSVSLISVSMFQYISPINILAMPLAGTTERISITSTGEEGNGNSYGFSISADGRYAAFDSDASNLVSGDTNLTRDIFVHDDQSGVTERVSVSSGGVEGDGMSFGPIISTDGRYVVFTSGAANLVSEDTNEYQDVFVHDRQSGVTERVSISSSEEQANSDNSGPSISADGRYITFTSYASNLVNGDTNGLRDIFVHDRQTGATERVSVSSGSEQGNGYSNYSCISSDGRFVVFQSQANNLVSEDTNGIQHIFVRNLQSNTTELVSVSREGEYADDLSYSPSISADGRYVAFYSYASNLISADTNTWADIFVRDLQSNTTELVSVSSDGVQGNKSSISPSMSADGRFVAFLSEASNLVLGDTNGYQDIFVHDRLIGVTGRVSVSSSGEEGNNDSFVQFISAGGRFVGFTSAASNLVSGDTNAASDVFVHDRCPDGACFDQPVYLPLVIR